jgi:hypothetical protein
MPGPTWEVRSIAAHVAIGRINEAMAGGWEPFSVDGGLIWLRRTVQPVETEQCPTPPPQ